MYSIVKKRYVFVMMVTLSLVLVQAFTEYMRESAASNDLVVADYTFMVYMMGTDLEEKAYSATNDIVEMQSIGSTSNVNVIIETGGGGKETTIDNKRFIDFSKVQRHRIDKNSHDTLADLGSVNMGDANTLSEFIKWGVSAFPAKRYAIILWDHGSGINGLGADKNFNNDVLNLAEIGEAFANASQITNKKFELVGFDACLMASIEVANTLAPFAQYMAASEEIEPSWGWDYSGILASLTKYSNQNGALLGKSIADSFYTYSKAASMVDYSPEKTATLSVINLTKIAPVVDNVQELSSYLANIIANNYSAALSLTGSVDSSERYGLTAKGSSGLVDLYDLLSNIKEKFPQSASQIEAARRSLNQSIVYKINGDAKPNANGLSIYMPLKSQEFSGSVVYTLPGWQKIVNERHRLLSADKNIQFLPLNLTGDLITGQVSSNDVSRIALGIHRQIPGSNTVENYVQEIEPSSVIDSDGSFKYKWNHTILSLCNSDGRCLPSTMYLETSGDRKLASFPVILQSQDSNQSVSLTYEVTRKGDFEFLGVIPEILQNATVPKEQRPLYPTDKIYIIREDIQSDLSQVEGATNPKEIQTGSKYTRMGPLEVSTNFGPKYNTYDGIYLLNFQVCDYSDNCAYTNSIYFNLEQESKEKSTESQDRTIPKQNASVNDLTGMFTYKNSRLGIDMQYPPGWEGVEHLSSYNFGDIEFISQIENRKDRFLERLQIFVNYSDPRLSETIDGLVDRYRQNKSDFELIESAPITLLGNNRAHKIVYTNTDGQHKFKNMEIILTKGFTLYTISFLAEESKYSTFLPSVQKMIDSFRLADSLTYENVLSGVTLEYPYDWQGFENDSIVYFFSPWENALDKYQDFISITSVPYLNLTLDEFANRRIQDLRSYGIAGPESITSSSIAGSNPAYRIVSNGTLTDNSYVKIPIKVTEYVMMKGIRGYTISYFVEESKYSTFLPSVQKMIDSFRLADSLTYENRTVGIKFQYPYDWVISPLKGKFEISESGRLGGFDNLIQFGVYKILDGTYPSFLYVAIHKVPLNFLGIERRALDSARQEPDFELVEATPTSLSGSNPAHKIVFTYSDPNLGKVKEINIEMVKNNKWYIFAYSDEIKRYSNFFPTIQKMIDSLEIRN